MNQSQFIIDKKNIEASVDPLLLFESCKEISNPNYRILFESSESGTNGCQQSMLLLDQALKIEAQGFLVSITALNDNGIAALTTIKDNIEGDLICNASESILELEYVDQRLIDEESKRVIRKTPLDAIRQVLSILSAGNESEAEKLIVAGVAGYDLVDSLELLPSVEVKEDDFPDYLFLLSDSQIIIDHSFNKIEIRQVTFSGNDVSDRVSNALNNIEFIEEIIRKNDATLKNQLQNYPLVESNTVAVEVFPEAETFKSQVLKIQEAIAKGQIFQTVISRNFSLDCNNTILAYQFLKQQNPSPYQFYLQLGEFVLFGASPESSIRYQSKDRKIGIMPIAGTRGRGRSACGAINDELDARLEVDLKLDEKEQAEHLMLVDLARNDLARISETGSRKVRELMSVYRYASVMHMVSRIEATLRDDLDIYHACQSCFHMGTLTGAPKKEAMTLIRQTEQRRRGVYGGAVGYFTGAGDMDTAIVIRSALVKNNKATITAGAGIVADSTPEGELVETELKAASVIQAIRIAENYQQLLNVEECANDTV